MPIPSDRDRAEPVGTPLLRLTPPLGDTTPAPAKLDALGDAAEMQFTDSVARYSHADWEREQEAEPTRHAAVRYITIGRPSALPADFLSCYPSHNQPPLPPDADWCGTACALPEQRGAIFLAPGYACVPRTEWLPRYRDTVLPKGFHFGIRAKMGYGGLEKTVRVRRRMGYTWSDF